MRRSLFSAQFLKSNYENATVRHSSARSSSLIDVTFGEALKKVHCAEQIIFIASNAIHATDKSIKQPQPSQQHDPFIVEKNKNKNNDNT